MVTGDQSSCDHMVNGSDLIPYWTVKRVAQVAKILFALEPLHEVSVKEDVPSVAYVLGTLTFESICFGGSCYSVRCDGQANGVGGVSV